MTASFTSRRICDAAIWLAIAAALIFLAVVYPYNHDESQYYAAGRLAAESALYRDFPYMQTPLFAWVAALIWEASGSAYLMVGRAVQAVIAGICLALMFGTARAIGMARREAWITVGMLAASYSFLSVAVVFRNDTFPLLLELAALRLLLPPVMRGDRPTPGVLAFAGFLICLAASAKITFGLLGLAPLVWIAAARDWPISARLKAAAALGAGGAIGLLPILIAIAPAPQLALWQNIVFNSEAPHHWWTLVGERSKLTMAGRVVDWAGILLRGPALAALIVVIAKRRTATGKAEPPTLMLDLFIAAGFFAAIVPVPSWPQYFIPLLPPLFLRASMILEEMDGAERRNTFAVLMLFVLMGSGFTLARLGKLPARPELSMTVQQCEARRLNAIAANGSGIFRVATLAPQIPAAAPLASPDPAFAAGPFLYRWMAPAAQLEISENGGVTPLTLEAHFTARPPAAILTGYEKKNGPDLDASLVSYAEEHGYHRQPGSCGGGTLWLAPERTAAYRAGP